MAVATVENLSIVYFLCILHSSSHKFRQDRFKMLFFFQLLKGFKSYMYIFLIAFVYLNILIL